MAATTSPGRNRKNNKRTKEKDFLTSFLFEYHRLGLPGQGSKVSSSI
jgi:hypothetical protein